MDPVAKVENEMETEDTANSDGGGGSRKRPLEVSSNDENESSVKRSNLTEDEVMNLKVMIPTQTAGALIGKNGETIAMIQKETNCRIKMSKNSDFFPCTNERLALITGPANCLLKVIEFVIDKTKEKYDPSAKQDQFDHKQTERWKEIKMIIPSSAAGMIIGKAGEYIKSIKDQTGAFVQISAKDQVDHRLLERVVTVVGNSPNELVEGAQMIVAKLLLDPNQSSPVYTNVSYHQIIADLNLGGGGGGGHGRSSSPSGGYGGGPPPFGASQMPPPYSHRPSYSPQPSSYDYHYQSPPPQQSSNGGSSSATTALGGLGSSSSWAAALGAMGIGAGATSSSSSSLSNLGNIQVLQFLEGLRSTLRNNGYSEPSITEIMHAMQVLAKYNVLGLGLGFGLAAVSKLNTSGGQNSADSSFFANPPNAGLNSAAFLNKDLNSSSFGAVGSGRQANVGFAGFDSQMMELNEFGSQSLRHDGSDRQSYQYPGSGGGGSGAADYMSREQQPLYVSRSSGSRYDDSGPPPPSSYSHPSNDYASSVIREFRYEPNKLELAIPEAIVGAVLGKQGRNLLEIQHYSGAKVEVSKRGQYVSGTQDRLITITGSGESIRVARSKIENSINDEQSKREHRRY